MNSKSTIFHDVTIRIAKLMNLLLMVFPFVLVWYTFYADKLWVVFERRGHWLVILLYTFLYFMIGRVYDAFNISYNSTGEMMFSQLLSLFEVNVVMYIVAWLLIRYVPFVLPFLGVYSFQVIVALIWSKASKAWYYKVFPANKTVVVWDRRQDITRLIDQYNLTKKYKVVSTVSVAECSSNLSMLNDADTVFLAGVRSIECNMIINYCLKNNIKALLMPQVGDLVVIGSKGMHMFHMLFLKVERNNPSIEYLVIKRIGDIILSIIGLIILSPVLLITSICIKAEDHGPVIYKQCRLTKNGKKFMIYKFRSMRIDAEKDGVARLSTGDKDDRVTKVGRFIRKVRIDELPQLINILKGDLTIVGPRAERPELVEEYQKELPEFELRLQVKAGLTGYAQVYGKYNTTPYDKLLMDLMYIANANIFEDMRIIFATIKILFMPDSTEGIAEGKTTAMEEDEKS